jgi:hypothetical protein
MKRKNSVHSGVIESCKNGESLSNLNFVQLLLSIATKSKFKPKTHDPVPASFRQETGPDHKSFGSKTGTDRTGSGRLLATTPPQGRTPREAKQALAFPFLKKTNFLKKGNYNDFFSK